MITERNVANLLITVAGATTLAGDDGDSVFDHVAGMAVGEPVVTNPGGVIISADGGVAALDTAVQPLFKIGVRRANGTILWSDIINANSVKSIKAKRYVAAANQVDRIGYNGTAGSIEAINNNLYTMRLNILPLDKAGFMQQMIKRATYKSGAAATQLLIARGIASSLIKNLSREPDKLKFGEDRIRVERIYSGAQANALGTATAALTKGSKYVVFSEDMTALVVAGTILRFGATGAGTAPVHICVGHDGGAAAARVYEMDIAWQGTTTAALAAGSVESAAAGGDWGIQLTGTAYASDPPKFFYAVPRWTTTLEDWGTTTVTNATRPFEGDGVSAQIAQMEQQFQGNEGNLYRAQVPSPTFRSATVAATNYGTIVIEFEDDMTTNLGQTAKSLKQLYIAIDRTGGDGGTILDAADVGLCTTLAAYATDFGIPVSAPAGTLVGEVEA